MHIIDDFVHHTSWFATLHVCAAAERERVCVEVQEKAVNVGYSW